MGKVTKIEEQKRNKNRVNVYLDGNFFCGLFKETVIKNNLYEGREVSETKLSELEHDEELFRAKEKVRNYLSYRFRSKKEVEEYLLGKGFDSGIIKGVISDFEDAGLLDDEKFAELWIKDRNKRKPKGDFALKRELQKKGVDEKYIKKALELTDERENAEKAARKAFRKYRKREDRDRRVRAYLSRRGFPSDLIREIIEDYKRTEKDSRGVSE